MAYRIRAIAFVLALAAFQSANGAPIRRVILPGDDAPGVAGATFGGSVWPAFDSEGNIRLDGVVGGPGENQGNRAGIWTERNGHLQLSLMEGDPLSSGTQDERISYWDVLHDDRDWVQASLTGPQVDATNDMALVTLQTTPPRTIVRTGQAVPGMPPDTRFFSFGYLHGNNGTENLYFDARVTGPGINVDNDEGIWLDDGTAVRTVVREGDIAPGTTGAIRRFQSVDVDRQGHVAFVAELAPAVAGQDPETAICAQRNGRLEGLLQSGMQAPGLRQGVLIQAIHDVNMTVNGSISFAVYLKGEGVNTANNEAIYGDRGKGLELIARRGQPVPGLPKVTDWYSPLQQPNHVILTLQAGREEWHFTETGWIRGASRPRHGDPAPGTSTTFAAVDALENSLGRMALKGWLYDDETQTNWHAGGIWAEDQNGSLQLLLKNGDLVETQPGIFAPVSMDDWQIVDFNDRGEVLLEARIDGADGVFVATVDAVPEPGTWALGIVGMATTLLAAFYADRRHNPRLSDKPIQAGAVANALSALSV